MKKCEETLSKPKKTYDFPGEDKGYNFEEC